jgi:YegS/Rv2252/BmrU family lipid kinase
MQSSPTPQQDLPRQAILIVNARSRRGRKLYRDAVRQLKDGGIELIERHAIRNPEYLTRTVEESVAKGAPMIIVGGGDGSLSSAVDYLVGTDTVFALLPLGTANSFARSMNIPLDLSGAIDVICNGTRRRVDLGMIDDDYYANCAAIGISPMIGESVPHWLKGTFGKAGYLVWAVWCLLRFKPFTLIVDGERMSATEVRIANGSFHGGTELVDEAEVDSGRIVVQVVTGTGRRHLAWNWIASIARLPARHATTREITGRAIRLETEPPLPISIDGEVLAHTPVTASIARAIIEVAAPRG